MSDFVNTVDIIDDDILMDGLIERSISGSFNDDKITMIRSNAFAYCTNLESVCFPNATSIGNAAFRDSGLKAITPETFPKVTQIPYQYSAYTFTGSALETVDWPSLTTLYDSAVFIGCTALKSLSLPNFSLCDEYGSADCAGCISLTDVNLPLATKAGFENCTSLETITLPCLQEVGGYCFNNCTSLQVIDLPSCTKMTGHSNFINCQFKALILRSATVCDLSKLYDTTGNNGAYSFNNSSLKNGTGYVYVPRNLLDSYKAAIVWSYYPSQFRALEDYTVDGTTTGVMREHCESLSLDVTELTFTDGNSQTLTATGVFGILDEITWTSSDRKVASVHNGVVIPTSDGAATITVTCGGFSATCAVTVNAGLDINILRNVGFNSGYLSNNGTATNGSTSDAYTDKFNISDYVGESIEVQLIDVRNTASNSRICYYNANNACVGYTQAATASYGAVITSTVPNNAVYAAISVNKSSGFSAIDIYCDGARIGSIDYTS